MYDILGIFILSFLLGLFYSYIMGKLNVVDKPDGYRKIHKNPVPPAGGLVLISIWLFLLYLFPASFSKKEIFFPILLFLTGFLDDIFDLAVIIKLMVQLVATFIISYKNNNPLYYTVITTLFYAIYTIVRKSELRLYLNENFTKFITKK